MLIDINGKYFLFVGSYSGKHIFIIISWKILMEHLQN